MWDKEPWYGIKDFFVSVGLYLLVFLASFLPAAAVDLLEKLF